MVEHEASLARCFPSGGTARLIRAHNPATILELRPREAVDPLIAGHTHVNAAPRIDVINLS